MLDDICFLAEHLERHGSAFWLTPSAQTRRLCLAFREKDSDAAARLAGILWTRAIPQRDRAGQVRTYVVRKVGKRAEELVGAALPHLSPVRRDAMEAVFQRASEDDERPRLGRATR